MTMPAPASVVIVGAGPAGLAAALVLAGRGVASTLIGTRDDAGDTRTTALLTGSVEALREAGAWEEAAARAAPLRTMAIVDATTRLVRARPLAFRSEEIGLEAFGWNIANGDLNAALEAAAAREPRIERIRERAAAVRCTQEGVEVVLEGGATLLARLAVAADGRGSAVREAAGIAVRTWTYPQTAIAVNLRIARPHRDTSTEFHTESGPFTLVPRPGLRASLVWVTKPERAEALAALDDEALAMEIERQSHSMLGRIAIDGPRSAWPMAGLAANRLAAQRVALVGEAAHSFPPIGAQGFNLTMRDVLALADAVAGAPDPGEEAVLARYDAARRADVASRTAIVDLLNRSLLTDFLPVQLARRVGFDLLDAFGPLRRMAMRQGLAPGVIARAGA